MPKPVWILDTTWEPCNLEAHKKQFPFLNFLQTKLEIQNRVRELSKKEDRDYGAFHFVHHSDVLEEANLLDGLMGRDNFVLFSGASAGANDGVLPRSRIERHLDAFLRYWECGDEHSARQRLTTTQSISEIDKIRLWLDRAQHDYINLLAPLDLLVMAYVSGEINEATYIRLRDQMTERLRDKADEFLKQQSPNLRGLARVFKEAVTLFENEDPQKVMKPTPLPEEDRLASFLIAQLLHVDDEIDKGWDLVMPAILSRYESQTDPGKVIDRIDELQRQGKPFLVLLDLGLKSDDSTVPKAWRGIDLLREIRARFKAVPVQAFSARHDIDSYRQVLEAGANGFIHKTIRVLSSDDEARLFSRFRSQLLRARYDIFRYFLYQAFDSIHSGLKNGTIELPFEDSEDRKWRKRQRNLSFLLEQLLHTDFERTTRDQGYSDIALRNLILAVYRPFEKNYRNSDNFSQQEPSEHRPHWKTTVLKDYRNACAHSGREDVISLDVRDAMLAVLLVLDPETLDGVIPEQARSYAKQAFEALFREARGTELQKWLVEAKLGPNPKQRLLQKMRSFLPDRVMHSAASEDPRLLALMADKLRNPEQKNQEIGLLLTPQQEVLREMVPLAEAKKDPVRQPVAQAPDGMKQVPRKTLKGMDYCFIGEGDNRFINFGKRYLGVKVDGKDPDQQDFFSWYYNTYITGYPWEYKSELIEFLQATYGVGPSMIVPNDIAGSADTASGRRARADGITSGGSIEARTPKVSEIPIAQQKEEPFRLSLFRIDRNYQGDPKTDALKEIERQVDGAILDGKVYLKERSPGPQRLGVKLRLRQGPDQSVQFLQINPTVSKLENHDERSVLLNYRDAQRLIATAADAVPWIDHLGAISRDFEHAGCLVQGKAETLHVADSRRLREVFNGMRLAVVGATQEVQGAVEERWKRALEQSGAVRIAPVNEASALVVIVPENCSDELLEQVRGRFERQDFPWKVVNPNPTNKDWNVLVGIATRLGLESIAPIRARDPNTRFLGLDVGHRAGQKSVVAATLVDHQGRLIAWTKVQNSGQSGQTIAEKISEASMRYVGRALFEELGNSIDWSSGRLVIHRDGRTLEDVEAMLKLLDDEFGIRHVDWLDVDKQRAPLFFVDPRSPTGQFVVFEDNKGRKEMWIRTAPGRGPWYSRPLCLVPWNSGADIETLGLEVFDLSNVATQDYEMKTKLPITTYFADGFSSTGAKRVSFWGYDRFRRE